MSKLPKALLALACVSCLSLSAYAQEAVVTLKVHHFLPAHSLTQANLLKPWADEITEASDGRIQFQFYPSMQLGGTPPQLVDQVRDGVADIVWTLPGYNSGRFPLISVFEQPFMSRSAGATSQAMWEFVAKHGEKEFTGMHLLATHTTDGALIHTGKKPINKMADFRGKKIRAANRTSTKLISLLGGTPVAMPVPQIPEALSKGVVDGAIVPWDVVPALKLHELVGHHTEMAEGKPALMYTVMILAMNPATYEGLPEDLRKIIDERSGAVLSRRAGQLFDEIAVQNGHRLAESRGNKIHQLSEDEQQKWMKVAERLDQDWIKEVEGKGYANGAALLEDARQLIQQHSDTATR
ncbi:TRAP transporter substrate-binding protein [Stutzerimonas stutzeri]|uniref:TRAP transporter substrate-binding protein n=1 Tax=Stutzerimonas stutzeri TaxID=316 RepID=UPI0022442C4A|nr:TRAP transporter substrate-binding protein [Stutzerimonas stutzeri]MCW8163071.1 C4-dicarboxylate ABC transporter [Stutzerimonas stutzeri]